MVGLFDSSSYSDATSRYFELTESGELPDTDNVRENVVASLAETRCGAFRAKLRLACSYPKMLWISIGIAHDFKKFSRLFMWITDALRTNRYQINKAPVGAPYSSR